MMKNDNEVLDLIKKTRDSSFNRTSYSVTKELKNFVEGLLLHTDYDNMNRQEEKGRSYRDMVVDNKEWLGRVTPAFQRDNNKWTKKMKLKFIENILSGVRTEFLYFRFNEGEDAQIIDGLQRTTAILDFINGKVKPFGFSYKELFPSLGAFRTDMTIKIYTFSNWEEVGKFYIDMNENITHSKKDIQKAKDWFLAEHNIIL